MKITTIVACDSEYGIGVNGKLPPHIPEELRMFREYTLGKPVVMGRKTYDSLNKQALPGRRNFVLTRDPHLIASDAVYSRDHLVLIDYLKALKVPEVCIIGGAEIYKLFAPMTNKLLLTIVAKQFETDAQFPIEAFGHLTYNGNMTSSSFVRNPGEESILWRRIEMDDSTPYANA